MSPEDRKAASEAKLLALGVPINPNLPTIEEEAEVELRSEEEVLRRLIALWAVVDKAYLKSKSESAAYISLNKLESWLSTIEREFLFNNEPSERDAIHFSWQLETLYFIAWCAGLLECSEIPNDESSVKPILGLFPNGSEKPERLQSAIRLRSKQEVMDRSDLLYRMHWAVRNATITGSAPPEGIDGGVVQEWHRAVNWMTKYDLEDDWDHVGTDT